MFGDKHWNLLLQTIREGVAQGITEAMRPKQNVVNITFVGRIIRDGPYKDSHDGYMVCGGRAVLKPGEPKTLVIEPDRPLKVKDWLFFGAENVWVRQMSIKGVKQLITDTPLRQDSLRYILPPASSVVGADRIEMVLEWLP